MLRHRSSSGRDPSTSSSSSRKNVSSNKSMWRPNRENRKTLNYDARSYRPVSQDGSAGKLHMIPKLFIIFYLLTLIKGGGNCVDFI